MLDHADALVAAVDRSALVKHQLRDFHGRWIEMGAELKWKASDGVKYLSGIAAGIDGEYVVVRNVRTANGAELPDTKVAAKLVETIDKKADVPGKSIHSPEDAPNIDGISSPEPKASVDVSTGKLDFNEDVAFTPPADWDYKGKLEDPNGDDSYVFDLPSGNRVHARSQGSQYGEKATNPYDWVFAVHQGDGGKPITEPSTGKLLGVAQSPSTVSALEQKYTPTGTEKKTFSNMLSTKEITDLTSAINNARLSMEKNNFEADEPLFNSMKKFENGIEADTEMTPDSFKSAAQSTQSQIDSILKVNQSLPNRDKNALNRLGDVLAAIDPGKTVVHDDANKADLPPQVSDAPSQDIVDAKAHLLYGSPKLAPKEKIAEAVGAPVAADTTPETPESKNGTPVETRAAMDAAGIGSSVAWNKFGSSSSWTKVDEGHWQRDDSSNPPVGSIAFKPKLGPEYTWKNYVKGDATPDAPDAGVSDYVQPNETPARPLTKLDLANIWPIGSQELLATEKNPDGIFAIKWPKVEDLERVPEGSTVTSPSGAIWRKLPDGMWNPTNGDTGRLNNMEMLNTPGGKGGQLLTLNPPEIYEPSNKKTVQQYQDELVAAPANTAISVTDPSGTRTYVKSPVVPTSWINTDDYKATTDLVMSEKLSSGLWEYEPSNKDGLDGRTPDDSINSEQALATFEGTYTYDEGFALSTYLGDGFVNINTEMRNPGTTSDETRTQVNDLRNLVSKSTLKEDTEFYRGAYGQWLEDLSEGDTVSDGAFISGSRHMSDAETFANQDTGRDEKFTAVFNFIAPKGTRAIDIDHGFKKERVFYSEGEILIEPSSLRIDAIDDQFDEHDGSTHRVITAHIVSKPSETPKETTNDTAAPTASTDAPNSGGVQGELPQASDVGAGPSDSDTSFTILDDPGESGDGYFPGAPGLWGKYGAAGVLVQHTDDQGVDRYLLVQRGNWVSSNVGKWQLPGGALDSKETDYNGAARELQEELSPPAGFLDGLQSVDTKKFEHPSGWHYSTIAASSPEQFEPQVDGKETGDAKWFTKEEIDKLHADGDLHPAIAKSYDSFYDGHGQNAADLSDAAAPATAENTSDTSSFADPKVVEDSAYVTVPGNTYEKSEVDAVRYWSMYGHEDFDASVMNGNLRYGDELTDSERKIYDGLNSALERSSLTKDTTLFRGTNGDWVNELGIGDEVTDYGFVATSANKSAAEEFIGWGDDEDNHVFEIFAPKGTPALDVSSFSKIWNENEILLPHGTSFRVTNIDEGESDGRKYTHIYAEIVATGLDHPAPGTKTNPLVKTSPANAPAPDVIPANPTLDDTTKSDVGLAHAAALDNGAPLDTSGWKKITGALGSNPGGIYEAPDGKRYYVKESESEEHAKNEVLADNLYQLAGIETSKLQLATVNGKLGTASELIDGAQPNLQMKLNDQDYKTDLQQGFAMDAWLANWDVGGLVYDNVVTNADGKPVRVDPGGALLYRAQGAPKGAAFGNSAGEWDTLRDGSNSVSENLFGSMSTEQLKESARKVEEITPEQIDEQVDKLEFNAPTAQKLKNTLKARREDIIKRAGLNEAPEPEAVPDVTPPTAAPSSSPSLPAVEYGTLGTDTNGATYVSDVNGQPIQLGTTVTSSKDGFSGTVDKIEPNGTYVRVTDSDGKKKTRNIKTLSVGNSNTAPAPTSTPEPDSVPSTFGEPEPLAPWEKELYQEAFKNNPSPEFLTPLPEGSIGTTPAGNQYVTNKFGTNIVFGETVTSKKDGFSGTVVKIEPNGVYVRVASPDGTKKTRNIHTLDADAPSSKLTEMTPTEILTAPDPNDPWHVPAESVPDAAPEINASLGEPVTTQQQIYDSPFQQQFVVKNPDGSFSTWTKEYDGKMHGGLHNSAGWSQSLFIQMYGDGKAWKQADGSAIPAATPVSSTPEHKVGDEVQSSEMMDSLPVGTKMTNKKSLNSNWWYIKTPSGMWQYQDDTGSLDSPLPSTDWEGGYADNVIKEIPDPDKFVPSGNTLLDSNGLAIGVGSKVKHPTKGYEGYVKKVGLSGDNGGTYVQVIDEKSGKTYGLKADRLVGDPDQSVSALPAKKTLSAPGQTAPSYTTEAPKPNPTSPWYGVPEPEVPFAVEADAANTMPWIASDWLDRANAWYKANKNPNKEIQDSGYWTKVNNAITAGNEEDLNFAFQHGMVSEDLRNEAYKSIAKKKEAIAAGLAADADAQVKYQKDYSEWRKANGLASSEFSVDGYTLNGMTGGVVVSYSKNDKYSAAKDRWSGISKEFFSSHPYYTTAQESAIYKYTVSSSSLNYRLRSDKKQTLKPEYKPSDTHVNSMLKNLDSAFEKNAIILPQDEIVERGGYLNEWTLPSGENAKDAADFVAKWQPGMIAVDYGFGSTAVGYNNAFGGSVKLKIRAPKGMRAIYVGHGSDNTGDKFASVGANPAENELILPRGTHYYIHSVTKPESVTWGTIVVEVEIVPPGWTPEQGAANQAAQLAATQALAKIANPGPNVIDVPAGSPGLTTAGPA